ncbi:MAG: signal peptidase I [Gemmatimonadaceae bacterium]
MTAPSRPDQRKKYFIMLLIAAVLAVAYMVYLAKAGLSLPTVSRRPGGSRVITYQDSPTAFKFGFLPILLGMFLFVVIVETVADGLRVFMRGKNAYRIYRSGIHSQTPLRVVSGILSAIVPGLGQAFGAHFVRAAVWLFAFIAATMLSLLIFLHLPSFAGVTLPLLFTIALRLAVVVDASRLELNRPNIHWSRRAIGVVGFCVAYSVAMGGFTIARSRMFGESFQLPSGSMQPTLTMGDYIMTVPLSSENVARNEIVVYRWSSDDPMRFVSRVVGIPGDTLAMRAGKLLRNGKEISEPFAAYDTTAYGPAADGGFDWQKNFLADTNNTAGYRPTRNDWGPLVVVRNAYFVLGDNRDNSLDSRYRGLVPADLISFTPQRIYYSLDPATGNFRWDRIGKIVRTSNMP